MAPRQVRERTPHILSTASNLLGFCLIVQTSLHVVGRTEATLIDDFTAMASLLLICACILSFLSMRSDHVRRSERAEQAADLLFMSALVVLFAVIVLVALDLHHPIPSLPRP